jgi:hypothetical protein
VGSSYFINVAGDVTLTNATETVVATLAGISTQRVGQRVELEGQINVTGGTSTTAYVLRIREDSLTGTLVDETAPDTLASAVGSPEDHTIHAEFVPTGDLSGKTFVLTVTQTGGAAAGTVNHGWLRADLTP